MPTQVQAAIATCPLEDARPVLIMAASMKAAVCRISRPKRGFAPAGMRPLAPAQVVRESMYLFAAVAPSLGRLAALVLPEANTAMMNLFLEEVSQTFADFFI